MSALITQTMRGRPTTRAPIPVPPKRVAASAIADSSKKKPANNWFSVWRTASLSS
jgi:hypothetical protein